MNDLYIRSPFIVRTVRFKLGGMMFFYSGSMEITKDEELNATEEVPLG